MTTLICRHGCCWHIRLSFSDKTPSTIEAFGLGRLWMAQSLQSYPEGITQVIFHIVHPKRTMAVHWPPQIIHL